MWSTPLALVLASALPLAAKLVHPSQRVDLVYPADTINVGQTFQLGVVDTNKTAPVVGLQRNVSVSLKWPNGTQEDLFTVYNGYGNCAMYPGDGYMGNMNVSDVGSYTAVWNFTFATSADPSKANGSYCGPEPYAFESYVVNKTFSVKDLGGGWSSPETTVSTNLPSQPTGLVKESSARQARSSLLPYGLVVFAVGLLWV